MTLAEIESRVHSLETELALLRHELEQAQVLAGIRRGLDAADAGQVRPAPQALEDLRRKLSIPPT